MAVKARTFCNVEAKKFQMKHSTASSLQEGEEDFLFGELLGALGRAPIHGGPSGGQHGGWRQGWGAGNRGGSLSRTKFGETQQQECQVRREQGSIEAGRPSPTDAHGQSCLCPLGR